MLCFFIFAYIIYGVESKIEQYKPDVDCLDINCKSSDGKVCGIRSEGEGYRLRLFENECALLDYNCVVKDHGYDITEMFYCTEAFREDAVVGQTDTCNKYDCLHPDDDFQVCGIRQEGVGFRIRIFKNKCQLYEHNCEHNLNFNMTEFYICNDLELPPSTEKYTITSTAAYKNIGYEVLKDAKEQDNVAKEYKSSNIYDSNNDEQDANNTAVRDDNNIGNVDVNDAKERENSSKEYNPPNIKDIDQENADNTINDDDFYIAPDADHINNENPESLDNDYTTDKSADEPSNYSHVSDDEETKSTLGLNDMNSDTENENIARTTNNQKEANIKIKNLVVIRGLLRNPALVNETIKRFFSATHLNGLPISEMPIGYLNETTRRRLIKIAGPINVYTPTLIIPRNISDDADHRPTLNSCFHKCPTKCPATYAPVCGVPGRLAREPSLMFLNHCYMDVAQCKMYKDHPYPETISSAYQDTQFVFCMGFAFNNMYKFLPLLKTLQHMGRLPKKGRFHYRLSNLRFFNNYLNVKNPNLMG